MATKLKFNQAFFLPQSTNKQKQGLTCFVGMPSHLLAIYINKPSYLYQFSHMPPDKPDFPNYGAFHTSEVPYTLYTLHNWVRPWQQLDRDLENMISSYWVNFAKTGNPNGAGLPEWKTYDKQAGNIMVLGGKVAIQAGLFKKEFDFLEDN
jgi:para-nitrobenzyl esterase